MRVGNGAGLLLLRLRLARGHNRLCRAGFFANHRSCLNRIGIFLGNNSVLSRAFVFVLLVIARGIILLGIVSFIPLTFDLVVSRFFATSSVVFFVCRSCPMINFLFFSSRILAVVLDWFSFLRGHFIFIFGFKWLIIPFRLSIIVMRLLTAILVVVTRTIIVVPPVAASLVVISAT